jgi:hypothetical protein
MEVTMNRLAPIAFAASAVFAEPRRQTTLCPFAVRAG